MKGNWDKKFENFCSREKSVENQGQRAKSKREFTKYISCCSHPFIFTVPHSSPLSFLSFPLSHVLFSTWLTLKSLWVIYLKPLFQNFSSSLSMIFTFTLFNPPTPTANPWAMTSLGASESSLTIYHLSPSSFLTDIIDFLLPFLQVQHPLKASLHSLSTLIIPQGGLTSAALPTPSQSSILVFWLYLQSLSVDLIQPLTFSPWLICWELQ